MASKDFQVDDLVWAKRKRYPLWPGKIAKQLSDARRPHNEKAHFIYLFGTKNFAWILDENISPHSESILNNVSKKKSAPYQKAIEEMVSVSKNSQKDKLRSAKKVNSTNFVKNENIAGKEKDIMPTKAIILKKKKEVSKKKKAITKKEKDTIPKKEMGRECFLNKSQTKVVSSMDNLKKKEKNSSKKVIRKRPLDIKIKEEPDECTSPKNQKLISEKRHHSAGSTPPDFLNSDIDNVPVWKDDSVSHTLSNSNVTDDPSQFLLHELLKFDITPHDLVNSGVIDNVSVLQEYSPSHTLSDSSVTDDSGQYILPTKKKIGFIGLGRFNIGRDVVFKFLDSDHNVTVWNKSSYVCKDFVDMGARKAQSPADLILACDITFCSISDPDALKEIIFGDCGILEGLDQAEKLGNANKGYVQLSTIDPETSWEICENFDRKGGKYLEAPIFGKSENALEGTLIIYASGARDLFLDCQSCFSVIGSHAIYISCGVGYGSDLSLLRRMFPDG